jgi:predicted MFS family arabinose efflux permease
MGQLIEVAGWRAPFFVLAVGLIVAWIAYRELPPTGHVSSDQASADPVQENAIIAPETTPALRAHGWLWQVVRHQLADFFVLETNHLSIWATILGGMLASFGMLHIAITYGAWLVAEYGLTARQLGTVALIIGCADLCGSVSASIIADRVGKRRSVLISWSAAALVALGLPWLNDSLPWAVFSLVLLRIASEYGIISHMSLISGQSTTQRGKVMTLAFAIGRIGGIIASFTGPIAYTTYGVQGLGPVSAIAIALAVVVILFGTRELVA